jgi:hypothetical protein
MELRNGLISCAGRFDETGTYTRDMWLMGREILDLQKQAKIQPQATAAQTDTDTESEPEPESEPEE